MKKNIKTDIQKQAEIKYADLAKDTVEKLNDIAITDIKSWIEMGQLVHDFVKKITNNGAIWIDAYKILADRPESIHQADMLRKYESAHTLYLQMKKKNFDPNIELTHILSVVHLNCDLNKKIEILRKAEENRMSVRDIHRYVAQLNSNLRISKKHNYNSSLKKIKTLINKVTDAIISFNSFGNCPLPRDIQKSIIGLMDLAVSIGNSMDRKDEAA